MNTIDEINRANVAKLSAAKKLPNFYPGDIIKVGVKITEGKRDRIQYFEGVCIAIQTPSKYCILSLLPSVIFTPTFIMSPG